MYNGTGMRTPPGSGTNGYIQTNKFLLKRKSQKVYSGKGLEGPGTALLTKKPSQGIMERDRKGQTELKLVILEDKLTDQGYTEAEIGEKLEEARRTLEAAAASRSAVGSR